MIKLLIYLVSVANIWANMIHLNEKSKTKNKHFSISKSEFNESH
jgi:hypothetical protein